MCKKSLRKVQMNESAFVDQSKRWTKEMVQRESRGRGDWEPAMRRLEVRYGVPFAFIWSLLYRPPKTVSVGAYLKLQEAYEHQKEVHRRRFEENQKDFVPNNRVAQALARAAAYVAGEESE